MNEASSLAATLRRFNRKERYWVVRNALGAAGERLAPDFCAKLEDVLVDRDVKIDASNAWWGMDYHFDWLVGALRMHCHGWTAGEKNAWINEPRAVRGNQEDIDLVIATGGDLILIEAKGEDWDKAQLRSKIERLHLLASDNDGVIGSGERSVRLHFVLTSPSLSARSSLGELLNDAPPWMRRGQELAWRWLELEYDDPPPDCSVHRSTADGVVCRGDFATIAVKTNAPRKQRPA